MGPAKTDSHLMSVCNHCPVPERPWFASQYSSPQFQGTSEGQLIPQFLWDPLSYGTRVESNQERADRKKRESVAVYVVVARRLVGWLETMMMVEL